MKDYIFHLASKRHILNSVTTQREFRCNNAHSQICRAVSLFVSDQCVFQTKPATHSKPKIPRQKDVAERIQAAFGSKIIQCYSGLFPFGEMTNIEQEVIYGENQKVLRYK